MKQLGVLFQKPMALGCQTVLWARLGVHLHLEQHHWLLWGTRCYSKGQKNIQPVVDRLATPNHATPPTTSTPALQRGASVISRVVQDSACGGCAHEPPASSW